MTQPPTFDLTNLFAPPSSRETRVSNRLGKFNLRLPPLNLEKRAEIKNQLTVTSITDPTNDKIVKGYRYTIQSKNTSVMLLNQRIIIDTPNVDVPIEFGAYEKLPAAPIIRNDIAPGEYFSSYYGNDIVETYVKLRDNWVCRHGLYIELKGGSGVIVAQYNMGIPVKFTGFQTASQDLKFIILYDKLGYPSSIDTPYHYIEYKGPFANGKLLYKQYPGINVTTTKDVVTGTYSIDMYLASRISDNKYINDSPYRLNTQSTLYKHLTASWPEFNRSIRMVGTLKPIAYHRNIYHLLDIQPIDDEQKEYLDNYLKMMTISEGPVKSYRTDVLNGQITDFFDDFNIINGKKMGVESIWLDSPCDTFNTIITHECHSVGTIQNIITIFWINGKYVTRDQYMIEKAKLEDTLKQSVVSTYKIPLGGIIGDYLGYFGQ